MKPISKIAFPVVAMAAALISSCGGGGESQDYYVSVQQFENGTKAFHLMGSPSIEVRSNGALNSGGHKVQLRPGFVDLVKGDYDDDGGSDFKNPTTSQDTETGSEPEVNSGTVVSGQIKTASNQARSEIAYYVEGGSTGKGYLYVTFQDTQGAPEAVVNIMGAIVPSQNLVTRTQDNNYVWIGTSPPIIITLHGIAFRIILDFNSGTAHCELCFQKVSADEGSTTTWNDQVEVEGYEPVLTNDIPFFAIDS